MRHTDMKPQTWLGRLAPWVAALLGLAALWIWADRLLPDGEAPMQIVDPEVCDLNQQACTVDLADDGRLTLDLQPRPIPTLRPVEVRLEMSGRDPDWVELDLAGVEMFMGLNRARLERVAPGQFRGEIVVPVCVSESMTWAATLLPEGDEARSEVQFHFVTRR